MRVSSFALRWLIIGKIYKLSLTFEISDVVGRASTLDQVAKLTDRQSAKGQKVWEVTLDMPGGGVRVIRIWANGETSASNKAIHRYRGSRVRSIRAVFDAP